MLLADGKATRGCGVADGAGWRTGDPTTQQQGKRLQRTLASPHAPPAEARACGAFSMMAWAHQELLNCRVYSGRQSRPGRWPQPCHLASCMHCGHEAKTPCGPTVCGTVRCDTLSARTASRRCRAGPETPRLRESCIGVACDISRRVGDFGDGWIRADQGRHLPKRQPEGVTTASARTSGWRSRHGRRPGAHLPANRIGRTGG